MYLCAGLKEHTLLQAIARVNRLYENEALGTEKEFGYIIDYVSILGELDQALTMYSDAGLEDFDEADLEGTLTSVLEQIKRLPQIYSDLWDLFKEVKNQHDEEAYELLLGDLSLREEFYRRLADFSKVLAMAFSTERFIMNTCDSKLDQYRNDLKRFHNLKAAVKLRYAEAIDYRDYEPKIKKLLDTHIEANEVMKLNDPVNIFDDTMFDVVKEQQGVYSTKATAATADAIAHATKKVITEKLEEDPAYYEKFSKLIQQAIDDFRAKRLSDIAYLKKVTEYRDKLVRREHDDVPTGLKNNDDAQAFYGVIKRFFEDKGLDSEICNTVSVDSALAVLKIFSRNRKVQFWDDDDAKNRVIDDIDDFLYDELKRNRGVVLTTDDMDEIIEEMMRLAKNRRLLEK
jgi:type I restriction enzyme R subunit